MSTIPTCRVRAVITDSDGGLPIAGAVITAQLSSYEVSGDVGYVVPQFVTAETDAAGQAFLDLWPNQLGSASSFYNIKIVSPNGKQLRTTAVVPNQPTADLHAIAELPVYDGKPDGAIVISEVMAARDVAVAGAETATSARDAALNAKGTAETKAAEAAAAKDSASASEIAAISARNQANFAAGNAASDRLLAQGAASTATGAKDDALTARQAAQAAAGNAAQHKDDAGAAAAVAAAARDTAVRILPKMDEMPPENPIEGQRWKDPADGRSYEWTVTASSASWVEYGAVVQVGVATAVGATGAAQQAVEAKAAAEAAAAVVTPIAAGLSGNNGTAQIKGTWLGGTVAFLSQLATVLGASLIGWTNDGSVGSVLRSIADKLRDSVTFEDFGAIGDGTHHPLSERFASLPAAQVKYPHATSLTDSIDWAAIQAALDTGENCRAGSGRKRYVSRKPFKLDIATLAAQGHQSQTVSLRGAQYYLDTTDNVPWLELRGWPLVPGTSFIIDGGNARIERTKDATVLAGQVPSDAIRIVEGYAHEVHRVEGRGFKAGAVVHIYIETVGHWAESMLLRKLRGRDNMRGIKTSVATGDTTSSFNQTRMEHCEFNLTIDNAQAYELNGDHARSTMHNCGGWIDEDGAENTSGFCINGNGSGMVLTAPWFDGGANESNSFLTGPDYPNNDEFNSSASSAVTVVNAGVRGAVNNWAKRPAGWQWKFNWIGPSSVYGVNAHRDILGATGTSRIASQGAVQHHNGTVRLNRGAPDQLYLSEPVAMPIGFRRLLAVSVCPFANNNDNEAYSAGLCGLHHTELIGGEPFAVFYSIAKAVPGKTGGTEGVWLYYDLTCEME